MIYMTNTMFNCTYKQQNSQLACKSWTMNESLGYNAIKTM